MENQDWTKLKNAFIGGLEEIHKDLTDFIKEFKTKDGKKFEEVALFMVEASCHTNSYTMAARAFKNYNEIMDARDKDKSVEMPNIQDLLLDEAVKLKAEEMKKLGGK